MFRHCSSLRKAQPSQHSFVAAAASHYFFCEHSFIGKEANTHASKCGITTLRLLIHMNTISCNQTVCKFCSRASSASAWLPRSHAIILFLKAMMAKNSNPPTAGRELGQGHMPVMRALKRGRGGGMGTGKHNLPRQHVMSMFESDGLCKQDTAPA